MSTELTHPDDMPHRIDVSFDDLVLEVSELAESGKVDDANKLIEQHPEHAERLQRLLPAIEALATLDAPTRTSTELPQPKSLGDFRIIRELGRGGMGIVYEAEQLSLGRQMALKVLPLAATLSVQQLERFKNEARLAASLKHPHIVSVHSVGVERGVHYYAMELIEGCSLAEAIDGIRNADFPPRRVNSVRNEHSESDKSELSNHQSEIETVANLSTVRSENPREYFRQIARLIADAADALEYAHSAGIVHRDIKPGNLLLDADGQVHVTDFGLARLEADAGVTLTGDMLGTLRYMSPEQAAGKPGQVDCRADIHALGATLYELLTMRPVFAGNDRAKLLHRITEDSPTPLRQIDPKIPSDMETIVAKALEKEPSDRYQSAAEFASDLKSFLEDRAIAAQPPNLPQRLIKWTRRHTATAWSLAAGILLASSLFTWVSTKHAFEKRTVIAAVKASLLQASSAATANQIRLAQTAVDQAETQAARLTADNPIRQEIAALKAELARYERFMMLYEEARRERHFWPYSPAEEALRVYGVLDESEWRTTLHLSRAPQPHIDRVTEQVYELLVQVAHHNVLWNFRKASSDEEKLQALSNAESHLEIAATLREPTKGYFWVLSSVSQRMGDLTTGKVRFHHDAEALRLRALAAETPPKYAAELFYITRDRRFGAASAWQRPAFRDPFADDDELLAAYREMLRVDPEYYNAHFFTGARLSQSGRFEEALQAFQGCVLVQPLDLTARNNFAATLHQLGRSDEAVAVLGQAIELAERRLDDGIQISRTRGRLAGCLTTYGKVLIDLGDKQRAQESLEKALSIFDELAQDPSLQQASSNDRSVAAKLLMTLEAPTLADEQSQQPVTKPAESDDSNQTDSPAPKEASR